MNEQAFVDKRERDWKRLRELINKASGRRLESLSGDELKEFVKLYRRVSTDLSVARTRSRNSLLADHLNSLATQAYGVLYKAPRTGFWSTLVNSIALAAQTVRARWVFIAVAFAIFFGATLAVYAASLSNVDAKEAIVGPEMEKLFEHWKEGSFEQHGAFESASMGAMYASNNPRVAIIEASVGAATFGTASVYLLFQNGAVLGALASEMSSVGKLPFLVSSIAPHGVPEISGAIIAGAAGLLFGWAVINPGRRRRGDSLKAVGKDAMVLLLTSVALMFIAAPIEGFFSFNPTFPQELKAAVAIISLIAWMAFWLTFGRSESEPA